jgi:hypothetical protein
MINFTKTKMICVRNSGGITKNTAKLKIGKIYEGVVSSDSKFFSILHHNDYTVTGYNISRFKALSAYRKETIKLLLK